MDMAFNFVWQHRWGIMGVIFIHLFVIVYSINTVVVPYVSILEQDNSKVEISFELPQPVKEAVATDANGNLINTDYNVHDQREDVEGKYDSRFDQKSVDQSIYDDLKNLEKAEFEKLDKNKPKEEIVIPDDKMKPDPNKKPEEGSGSKPKGTTTAEYDLAGRRNEGPLPKPTYTCIGSGTLVVKIKVNRSGKVTSAKVDPQASSTLDECMKAGAEKYAMRAKFEASSTAPEPQEGTITYRYISQ